MQATEGFEVAFHGEYREIVPNERIVSTEIYEAVPAEQALTTATFEGDATHTTLTILTRHGSKRIRDMVIDSGMEGGLNEALDLLEQIATSLA
jgi:uncharacterized protein YndB with AHSA1/START domain